LFGTSEDFRIESLRLAYANLQAFVVYHANRIDRAHLPTTKKQVNDTIRAIYNPKDPSDWIVGIKKYILSVLAYFLCFEGVLEESDLPERLTLQMEELIGSL
jgi:hypothetical protein